ncbi:MAG: hypothetical protein IT344_08855 [Candidatus Dadabacteria bacterium]|nr:hypothetical protein [Candidatus Dadabacteria bacterium]
MINPSKTRNNKSRRQISLFNKKELTDIEQIRLDAYSKYEKGNPQFINKNYDSWVKGKVEGGYPNTTTGKRLLSGLVGYDYLTANNCIKDFVKSGDLKYILNAIDVLSIKAFHCPVIAAVILSLNTKYSKSLWLVDKLTSSKIETFFREIGTRLLYDSPQIITARKKELTVRKLQDNLSKRYKRDFSKDDTLQHIYEFYQEKIAQLGEQPIFKYHDDKNEILTNYESLMFETEKRLKTVTGPKQKAALLKEKKMMTKKMTDVKNLEDKLYKEARKLTIQYLETETGIKLGMTYFQNILTRAKKLNQA